jgi:spore germination protein KC
MNKKLKLLLCAALAAMALCPSAGCQSARDLNTLVIVMGMGMDADAENPGNIALTAQIVMPDKLSSPEGGGSGTEDPYYNLDRVAPNSFEAIREFTHAVSGRLYTAHAELFVIGREMAERGISPGLDFFVRAREARLTTKIVVSDTTAQEVLGIKPKQNKLPVSNIVKLVEAQISNSQSLEANLLDYIVAMQSDTTSFMAPMIRVADVAGEAIVEVRGMAVFKQDRMIGELNEDETRGVLWVLGEVKSTAINVEIAGGIASLDVLGAKSEVSPAVADGAVTITIKLSIAAELAEQTGMENLATIENMKKLQALAQEAVCSEIALAFNKAAALSADVFGFGDLVHQHCNKEWQEMKPDWDRIFPAITLEIKTELAIRSVGAIEEPAWSREEEIK